MKRNVAALVSGAMFGLGLAVSHMVEPNKVLAFLDVYGRWDPSLLLVMLAAVSVTFVAFRVIARRRVPLFAPRFYLPTIKELDRRLVIGSAVFGIGWGLVGYCPGPGIAALGLGTWEAPVFVAALAVGSFTYQRLAARGARAEVAAGER